VRSLQDNVWTLQSGTDAAGQPVEGLLVPGRSFVLRFDGPRLLVQGGCNNMSGSWRLSPQGQLMSGRLAATMKACEAPLMQADKALSSLLEQPLEVQLDGAATKNLRLISPGRHTLVLGPEARLLEPGDVVAWDSPRNGYEGKLFRVDGLVYKANLDVIVDITEVDPSDYDWDQETDFRPTIDGPLQLVGPRPMPMLGWQAFPATESASQERGGRRGRPASSVKKSALRRRSRFGSRAT